MMIFAIVKACTFEQLTVRLRYLRLAVPESGVEH